MACKIIWPKCITFFALASYLLQNLPILSIQLYPIYTLSSESSLGTYISFTAFRVNY